MSFYKRVYTVPTLTSWNLSFIFSQYRKMALLYCNPLAYNLGLANQQARQSKQEDIIFILREKTKNTIPACHTRCTTFHFKPHFKTPSHFIVASSFDLGLNHYCLNYIIIGLFPSNVAKCQQKRFLLKFMNIFEKVESKCENGFACFKGKMKINVSSSISMCPPLTRWIYQQM